MKRRISADARRDIATVLDWSDARFGLTARVRYENLIERGLTAITQHADPLGSYVADDGSGGLRVYHLRHCRADSTSLAVGRPRHVIVYRRISVDQILIVRLLHDAMDLPAHLADV